MAFLGQTYRADDLPKGGDGTFAPLPEGWYSATIVKAEVKQTKAGTGAYIALRLDITGPTHQGRVVFSNLNINNPSPKAQEIGLQQLNQIMGALGLREVEDSTQLIGGTLQAKLAIKTEEGRDPANEVKAYRAVVGSVPPAISVPPSSGGSLAAPKAAPPPWAKK